MTDQTSRALAFKQLRSLRRRLRRSIKQLSHTHVTLSMKARNILQVRGYIDLTTTMLSSPDMFATNVVEQELRHTTRQTMNLTRRYYRYILRQIKTSVPEPDLAELAQTADDAQDMMMVEAKQIFIDLDVPKAGRKLLMKIFKNELKGKPFGLSCHPSNQRLALAFVGKDPGLAVFKHLSALRTDYHSSDLIVADDNDHEDDNDNNNDQQNHYISAKEEEGGSWESDTDSNYVDADEGSTAAEHTPINFSTVSSGRHESIERFWD